MSPTNEPNGERSSLFRWHRADFDLQVRLQPDRVEVELLLDVLPIGRLLLVGLRNHFLHTRAILPPGVGLLRGEPLRL